MHFSRSPLLLFSLLLTFVFAACTPRVPSGTNSDELPLPTRLELSATPSPSKLTESVVLTAKIIQTKDVLARLTMGGTVTFTDKTTNTPLCNEEGVPVDSETREAKCETKFTAAYNHEIEAVYSGYTQDNVNYFSSSKGAWTQEISNKFKTQISLDQSEPISENPMYGDSFTLLAKVTSNDGASAGDEISGGVLFTDNNDQPLDGCEDVQFTSSLEGANGVTCTVQNTPDAGLHTYKAQFQSSTNSNYQDSDEPASHTVVVDTKSTKISLSKSEESDIVLGQPVTLTAHVEPTSGEVLSPITGTVIFSTSSVSPSTPIVCDNGHSAQNVTDGKAECLYTPTAIASSGVEFTAVYNADENSNYSNSPESEAVNVIVSPIPTNVSLESQFSVPNFIYADRIELIATVGGNPVGGAVDGTVEFKEILGEVESNIYCNRVTLGADKKAKCEITDAPSVGSHIYIAKFKSTAENYQDSEFSPHFTVQVAQRNTQISISSDRTPITLGQHIVLTATVAPNPRVPAGEPITGPVVFKNSATDAPLECENPGEQNVIDGEATCQFTPQAVSGESSFAFKATYTGTGSVNYAPSTTIQDARVSVQAISTIVTLSGNSSVMYGDEIQLTATVGGATEFGGALNGTVAFKEKIDGTERSVECDSIELSEDHTTAVCRLNEAPLSGRHIYTATFNSSVPNYSGSPALNDFPVDVVKRNTSVSVETPNPITLGDSLTLTAHVSANPDMPIEGTFLPITGSVVFRNETANSIIECDNSDSQIVNNGQATCTFTPTTVAATTGLNFTATYIADATSNYANSLVSSAVNVIVNAIPTDITLSAQFPLSTPNSGNNVLYGEQIQLVATVGGATELGRTIRGTVSFKENVGENQNPVDCENIQLNETDHTAVCTIRSLPSAAQHVYTAAFTSIEPNYLNSQTLNDFSINVQRRVTQTSVRPDQSSVFIGQTITLAAQVILTPQIPEWGQIPEKMDGTVAFQNSSGVPIECESGSSLQLSDDGNATCKYTTTSVNGGVPLQFTATYSGNSNYATSTSAIAEVSVNPISSSLTLKANDGASSVFYGERIQLYATVSLNESEDLGRVSGSVTFKENQNVICTSGVQKINTVEGIVYASGCEITNSTFRTPGSHTYTAEFISDNANYGTSSGNVQLNVIPLNTSSVNLTISPNTGSTPLTIYDTVKLTATVEPHTLKGTISFNYDSETIQSCPIQSLSSSGTATCVVTLPTSGRHVLKAVYTPSSEQKDTDGSTGQQDIDVSATQIGTPNSAIYIVTGSGRVAISTNGGITWATSADVSSAENPNDKILNFAVTPTGDIYVGTQNGYIFGSDNKGATWTRLTHAQPETPASPIKTLMVTAQHELIVTVTNLGSVKKSSLSTRPNEQFHNSEWGETTDHLPFDIASFVGTILPDNSKISKVLIAMKTSVYPYSNLICGTVELNQPLNLQRTVYDMKALRLNPDDSWDDAVITSTYIGGDDADQILYFGTKSGKIVYFDALSRLFPNDGNCELVSTVSPKLLGRSIISQPIHGIFVAPGVGVDGALSNSEKLRASTIYALQGKSMLVSTNQGASWNAYATPDGENARAIFVAPILYATTGNSVGTEGAIKISKDNGKTWIPLNSSGKNISSLFVLPQSGEIFITKDDPHAGLVFASNNGGVSWVPRSNMNNLLTQQQLTEGGAATAIWVDTLGFGMEGDAIQDSTLSLGFANGANLLWTGTGTGGTTKKWTLSTPSNVLYSDRRMNAVQRIDHAALMFAANPENGMSGRSALIDIKYWNILSSDERSNGWQPTLGSDQIFIGHNNGVTTGFANESQVYSLAVNRPLKTLYIGKNFSRAPEGLNGVSNNHILKSRDYTPAARNTINTAEIQNYPSDFWNCSVMTNPGECSSGWVSTGIPISMFATSDGTLYVYVINQNPNAESTKSLVYTTTDDGMTWQPFAAQPFSKADGSPQDGMTIKGYGTIFVNYQYQHTFP